MDSDYDFINDKLAVLYGIENVRHHDNIHLFDGLGRLKSDEFSADEADKHLESLKKTVTKSERRIARAFTKNLITFINGRKLGIDDLQRIDQIMDETKEEGYRAQDILAQIIAAYFPPHPAE